MNLFPWLLSGNLQSLVETMKLPWSCITSAFQIPPLGRPDRAFDAVYHGLGQPTSKPRVSQGYFLALLSFVVLLFFFGSHQNAISDHKGGDGPQKRSSGIRKHGKSSTSHGHRNPSTLDAITRSSRSRRGKKPDDDPERSTPALQKPPEERRGLACPFYLHDRNKNRLCGRHRFRNFSDVKQHLQRAHRQVWHCTTCGTRFDGTSAPLEWSQHQLARSCLQVPFEPFPGVTQDQELAISRITSTTEQSQLEKWWAMWDILFPDRTGAPPPSPWLPHTDAFEVQYMTDLRHGLLDSDQWPAREPQWRTAVMVSAFPEERRAVAEEVIEWFIDQDRRRETSERDIGTGAIGSRTVSYPSTSTSGLFHSGSAEPSSSSGLNNTLSPMSTTSTNLLGDHQPFPFGQNFWDVDFGMHDPIQFSSWQGLSFPLLTGASSVNEMQSLSMQEAPPRPFTERNSLTDMQPPMMQQPFLSDVTGNSDHIENRPPVEMSPQFGDTAIDDEQEVLSSSNNKQC